MFQAGPRQCLGMNMALFEAKVAVAPGAGFGSEGEGFVRLALVENEQRIRQAARGVKKFLSANGVNVPGGQKE